VLADPHYEAWHQVLREGSEQAAELRARGSGPEVCGSHDALREDLLRSHRLRQELLRSLRAGGVEPTPAPPGISAWPWGPGAAQPPRIATYDSMDTAVIVDDGSIVMLNINEALEVDPVEAARAFYDAHDDEYDFLMLFTNFQSQLFAGQFLAYHIAVGNSVEGLGHRHFFGADLFNEGPTFTGNSEIGQLQSFVHLNDLRIYPDSPDAIFWRDYTTPAFMAHEIGHRWGARLVICPQSLLPLESLLGRGNVHWSFFLNTGASVLEGNAWGANAPLWSTQSVTNTYGPLDLYLMGMLDHNDIPDGSLWLVTNTQNCTPSVDRRGLPFSRGSPPQLGVECVGERVDFDMDCVFITNGVRRPLYPNTQRDFRIATVLITLPDTPVQPGELEKIDTMRGWLADFFHEHTLGRGSLHFDLRSVPARVVFDHSAQGDVEDSPVATEIRTRVVLEPRSLPTTVDDVRLALFYAVDDGSFTELAMQRDGDEFFALIPPQPLNSRIRYYMRAGTTLSEHVYLWPEEAPSQVFDFTVQADTRAPTIAHAPVRRHSRNAEPMIVRAVVLDDHAVDEVKLEFRLQGGTLQEIALPRQGTSDVYETRLPLPAEARVGEILEYRIVAKDAATVPHVAAFPSVGFSALEITLVQDENVEQENPLWTHRSLTFNEIDEWHREPINHTEGGLWSWKVGPNSVSSNPRAGQIALEQDAVLEGPAVRLKQGWEVRFYHRYYFRTAPPDGDDSAVDGAIVEWQDVENAQDVQQDRWFLIDTLDGYNNQLGIYALFNPIQWYPVWSGWQDAWKLERINAAVRGDFDGRMIRFRFRVATSGALTRTSPQAGWYIDDIEIDPGTAVPITVEELRAQRAADGVRLEWRARSSEPGDLFRIYRSSSTDASSFQLLTTLAADPQRTEYVYLDTSAQPGRGYAYRLGLVVRGEENMTHEVTVAGQVPRFALHGNRPNPFNPRTTIRFELSQSQRAWLDIFDVRGHHVRRLVDRPLDAGEHTTVWDGTDDDGRSLPSGLYLYRLSSGSRIATRRMLLLR
jgi:hypothetical protein